MIYEKNDKPIKCSHCQGEEFDKSKAQLNTAFATLLGFDWANETAETFRCLNCGKIEWFTRVIKQKEPEPKKKCECCGRDIPESASECQKCGWVF